ncbi:MAG TPA: helix-turn-helix transcriptional regulator [Elusimicrobiales bacterium]|nr:helix-turn-helix transcriptional regulator [Elusimicrobiales bacterium]
MTKDIYFFVCKRIRQEREISGLTLEQLSEKAGISLNFLSCIVINRSKPSLKTIDKIATALNMSVSKLLEDVPFKKLSQNKKIKSQIEHLINTAKPAHKTVMLSTLKELSKSLNKSKK